MMVYMLSFVVVLLAFDVSHSQASLESGYKIKSATFLSPEFVLGPGSVENRYYLNIDFPRGHIALKSFDAEVVDEAGNPIPLHETYLHHWVLGRYFQAVTENDKEMDGSSFRISARNSGICQGNVLGQYFGLGSETRKTSTHVPDPFGIEIGNPAEIPVGYEEKWYLNVHAIDTRGVEDKLGCTECRCDLYNVTVDEHGRPLRPDYKGGLFCCYDKTQCKVKQGFKGPRRSLYLQYKVKWIDWDSFIIPVKIYIFDVTDTGLRLNGSRDFGPGDGCQVEYGIKSCSGSGVGTAPEGCIDVRRTRVSLPTGGYVIYGVAHQHTGAAGSTLYGEDGRVICNSLPIYGQGEEPGNEAGYVVGMSTCYPKPGSVRISNGENLTLVSNYSATQVHTGVMGLFYILVADRLPKSDSFLHIPVHVQENTKLSITAGAAVALLGLAMAIAIGIRYQIKKQREDGYQQIMA